MPEDLDFNNDDFDINPIEGSTGMQAPPVIEPQPESTPEPTPEPTTVDSNEPVPAPEPEPTPDPGPAPQAAEPDSTPQAAEPAPEPAPAPDPTAAQTQEPEPQVPDTPVGGEDDLIPLEDPEPAPEPQGNEDNWDYQDQEQVDILGEHLTHHTNGEIKSLEDINRLRQENAELKQKNGELQFANEGQKHLYEFAKNFDDPLAAGRNYLQAMSLNLENMSDRQKMFEGFMLDEQNADLTREQGIQIFDRMWNDKFEEADDDVLTKREIQVQVKNAEKTISKLQHEAKEAAPSKTPQSDPQPDPAAEQKRTEILANISQRLTGYDRIPVQAGDKVMNFGVSANDKVAIQEAANDMFAWLNNELNKFVGPEGNVNYDEYINFVSQHVMAHKIPGALVKHGQNIGTKQVVQSLQNPSPNDPAPAQVPVTDNRTHQEKVEDQLFENLGQMGWGT